MVHVRGQTDDAVPHMDAAGLARYEGQERLGNTHVRVLLEARVLDAPDHIEADSLSQERLFDDVVEDARVAFARRVSGLCLIDERELHNDASRCVAGGY